MSPSHPAMSSLPRFSTEQATQRWRGPIARQSGAACSNPYGDPSLCHGGCQWLATDELPRRQAQGHRTSRQLEHKKFRLFVQILLDNIILLPVSLYSQPEISLTHAYSTVWFRKKIGPPNLFIVPPSLSTSNLEKFCTSLIISSHLRQGVKTK